LGVVNLSLGHVKIVYGFSRTYIKDALLIRVGTDEAETEAETTTDDHHSNQQERSSSNFGFRVFSGI
jgi:hypothetical protein